MSNARSVRFDPRAAGLLFAGGMCLIPFLQPRHMPPIRGFYDEWFAFAFGCAAIAFAASARRTTAQGAPVLAVCLALFSLFLFARPIVGQAAYAQSPYLWGLYASFAAIVVLVGHDLASRFGQDRVCDVLATFVLAGALANAVSGVVQVVGIPREIDAFVSYLHGKRAIGNVGQSNLYANYLALGEASLVYLFSREKIGKFGVLAGGILLVGAAALAASRATPLYAAGFAALAYMAMRQRADKQTQKLWRMSSIMAVTVILTQWLVPVGANLLGFHVEGGYQRGTASEWEGPVRDEATHLRMAAWGMALRVFLSAPWIGVGPDAFAGAAFAQGLPPEMARDQVWTSPHNMVLHLLAETGLVGTSLVLLGLFGWFWQSGRQFLRRAVPSMWWLLACAGVECIHALLEYPLLYAHFLAIMALIAGIAALGQPGLSIRPLIARAIFGFSALAGAILLGTTLAAYLEFDLASPVATGRSLASDKDLARDRNSLAELGKGLLAPRAELWLFMAFPLDETDLERKVVIGERVVRFWPSRDVVVRQSILLALAGRHREAVALLKQGVRTYRTRGKDIAAAVGAAPRAAREVLREALPAPSPSHSRRGTSPLDFPAGEPYLASIGKSGPWTVP